MRYIKWTDSLKAQARFLLTFYRDYEKVANMLDIPASALKNYNNKYWKIDCKTVWTEINDMLLLELVKDGVSKKEIGKIFGVTENAVSIRLSQLNRR